MANRELTIQEWAAHLSALARTARRTISGDIEWTASQFHEFMEKTRDLCDAVDHFARDGAATKHETPSAELVRATSERNSALAVVRAVYQESKAIHAAYKSLPAALRDEVEDERGLIGAPRRRG